MKPELDAFYLAKLAVQHERVADLRRHGLIHALGAPALGHFRALGVPEQDPDPYSGAGLLGERRCTPMSSARNMPE